MRVLGGGDGMPGKHLVQPGAADEQQVPSRYGSHRMRLGEAVLVQTNGGGGFGDPRQRDPERVRQDVRNGYVSPAAAEHVYGVRPEA